MAEDLQHQVDAWSSELISRLEPKARRQLAQTIGRDLRRSQIERIRSQRSPDGEPYEPRKKSNPRRNKKGAIKRRLFKKLATAKHLKIRITSDGVLVGFFGRTARIARIHHEGLSDRVSPDGLEVKYPARPLLGITEEDRTRIRDFLLNHLGN